MARLGQTIALLAKANRGTGRRKNTPPILREVRGFRPNPGALAMMAHVPPGLAPKSPLVVVLHGCTQSAEGYAKGAGWIEAADRYGFALLCPEQTPANNPNVCFNWFNPGDTRRGGGEAASIAQMITHTIAAHDIDPARVFITGLSAGGAMANVLLATYPELFAGGAIIAGLHFGSANNVQEAFAAMAQERGESARALGDKVRTASSHAGPWPRISVWHGDRDATVSPSAGDAVVRQWIDVHGIRTAPQDDGSRTAWLSANGAVTVEYRRIPGMGHGTPLHTGAANSLGQAGPYLLDVGISSTMEILESWSIAQPGRSAVILPAVQTASATVPSPAQTPRPAEPAPTQLVDRSPRRHGAVDVGEVINQALRAAGLIK